MALSKQKMTAAAHDGCTSLLSRERCPSRYFLGSPQADLAKMLVVCSCANHGGSFSRTTRSTAHAIAGIKETFLAMKATWNSWRDSQGTVHVHLFSYTLGQFEGRREMLLTRDYHCSQTGSQQAGSLPQYFQLRHQTLCNCFVAQHLFWKMAVPLCGYQPRRKSSTGTTSDFISCSLNRFFELCVMEGSVQQSELQDGYLCVSNGQAFISSPLLEIGTSATACNFTATQCKRDRRPSTKTSKHQLEHCKGWERWGTLRATAYLQQTERQNYAPTATWQTNLQQIMFPKAHYVKQIHRKHGRFLCFKTVKKCSVKCIFSTIPPLYTHFNLQESLLGEDCNDFASLSNFLFFLSMSFSFSL